MRIKSPMCIVFGVICSVCFIGCIIQGKDLFVIAFCLFSAIIDFIAGLGE